MFKKQNKFAVQSRTESNLKQLRNTILDTRFKAKDYLP